jgi:eukaryotic-like serine/threonine-protein kinase
LDAGTVVAGRFQVDSLAGEGGMSVVYRATDRLTGDLVALKLLRDIDGLDPERFVREALTLAELSHPAIVRYIAHGALDGRPYLVMEWLVGEDLDQRLARQGLTMAESVALARRVCEALAAAHARGVIHRDIKPPNIFLPGGEIARAKVLDFGIARRQRATHAATRTGTVLGTPGYMAPEQVRGERVIDARVDVFSVGCVLFETITGRAAFEGDTPVSILARILIEDAPRASAVRPGIPDDLDALIGRMVARRKEERPQDASAVIEALDALAPFTEVGAAVKPARAAALTHGERRLVCVIAASTNDDVALASDHHATMERTMVSSPPDVALSHFSDLAAAHGGSLEALGSLLLVVFSGDGVARDLVARAARCALSFTREGAANVALVTGRAELHEGWPVGEAVDRAFALVEASRRGGGEHPRVALDDTSASLLAGSFRVEASPEGPCIEAEGEVSSIDRSELERGSARPLLGREIPCLGRERELATLDALLGQTIAEGSATAVVITGPAGIGKTRLLAEFLNRARARFGEDGLTVWVARGDVVGAGAPFGLIGPMLRAVAGVVGTGDLSAARARIRQRFGPALARVRSEAEAASALAWVGELAGVPFEDGASPELTAARADPQWMGDAMLGAWETLVEAESHERPLLVVFDNAHWGDPVSMRFVERALKHHTDRAWMALAVGREELHDAFPKLWETVGAQEVKVGGIARRSAERLCRAALGDGADASLIARLVERANGSPLFLEELLRASERGDEALPESVVAMVQSRVEAMEPEARRVLRAASVFGQVFWRGGVASLLGGRGATPNATPSDLAFLDEWLDELARREVIERHTRSTLAGEVEWAFRHDLLRLAAYAMLTGRDLSAGHGLAGDWLDAKGVQSPLALADHFALAGRSFDAARCLLDAARQSLEGHDLDAALRRSDEGVTHCQRARGSVDDTSALDRIEGSLRLVQTEARLWRGEPMQAVASGDEAMRLLPEGTAEWFRAAGEAGTARGRANRMSELRAWIERTATVTPTPGALAAWAVAFARVSVHLYYAGEFETPDRVLAAVERGIAGHDLGPLVEARMAGALAARAVEARDLDAVERETLRALQAYQRAGDIRNEATQLTVLGISAVRCGRNDEAEHWLDKSLVLVRRMRLPTGLGMTLRPLAQVYFRRGEGQRALDTMRESIAWLEATEQDRLKHVSKVELAHLHLQLGEVETADAIARDLLRVSSAPAFIRQYALALRALAALREGHPDEALALAREAFTLKEHDRTIIDSEAVAELAFIEALVAHGDTDEARTVANGALARLEVLASGFTSADRRKALFERVPVHAAIVEFARRLSG